MKLWFHESVKPLTITDSASAVRALQDEIRRSRQSCYDLRLHAVLLVAQGMTCPEVGRLLGVARRSVEYWVRHFEERGLAGVAKTEHCGRHGRLNQMQLQEVKAVIRGKSSSEGLDQAPWGGKSLKVWLQRQYGVHLGERQCQRLLRQLGFRRRRPHR